MATPWKKEQEKHANTHETNGDKMWLITSFVQFMQINTSKKCNLSCCRVYVCVSISLSLFLSLFWTVLHRETKKLQTQLKSPPQPPATTITLIIFAMPSWIIIDGIERSLIGKVGTKRITVRNQTWLLLWFE